MFRITPDVTGPARSITLDVTGSLARSIIPAVRSLAPVITPAEFTTYINYVSSQRISIKDRFRVWLQFILSPIDHASMALFYLYFYGWLDTIYIYVFQLLDGIKTTD